MAMRLLVVVVAFAGIMVDLNTAVVQLTGVAPAAAGGGVLYLFATSADGRIIYDQATPGAAFVGWREVPGGERTAEPVAAAVMGETLFVFSRRSDGSVAFNQGSPNGVFVGWQPIAGDLRTDAALTAAARPDALFVFAKALDGRILFNQTAAGGTFVGWKEIAGGERTTVPLGAAMANNVLFVFSKRPDGSIVFNRALAGGGFLGWQTMPGGFQTDTVVAAAGRSDGIFAVAKSLDGRVMFNQGSSAGSFLQWQEIAGGERTAFAPAAAMQGTTLFVFTRRSDGTVAFNQAAEGGTFVGWLNPDPKAAPPPPQPAAYDLLSTSTDPNGFLLNPVLGSQTWNPSQLADPSLCGTEVAKPPCTIQSPQVNTNWCVGGHVNYTVATYEGKIFFHDHSNYLMDDDYSLSLVRPDLAGVTAADMIPKSPDPIGIGRPVPSYLHPEFDSGETINYFHTAFWDALHQAVDADGGKGAPPAGSFRTWPTTESLINSKDALVTGVYTLDCTHSCGAEIHPVYAMAIHVHDSFDDDTWAVFVRNSGDEGFCGRDQVELNSGQPLTFSFLLPRPGATALTTIAADPSDSGGAHGTVFYSDHNAAGTGGFAPTLVPNVGALLTFTLPPPKERQMINGMLHMKWVVAVPPNHLQQETILQETLLSPKAPSTTATRSPQHQLQDLIDGMTSSEATAFMRRVRTASPPSRGRAVPLALSAHAPGIVPHKSIPRLSFAADLRLEQRINAVIAALRAQFGSRVDEILKSPHKTP